MKDPQCAKCKNKPCYEGITDESKLPPYCPIRNHKDLIESVKPKYASEEWNHFFLSAAVIEKEAYNAKAAREENKIIPVRPRVREIAEFAHKIGAKKLGIAFCSGLADEASRAVPILESHDLEICSAVCCCGALDKTALGVPAEEKIRKPEMFEATCNPILQAELLNRARTDFNIIIGLCVGHDMLFTKFSKAPVTTLVVKDRMTGHNPVISLYTRYHRFIV